MKVLAHRGLTRRHPENTLGAFQDALDAGVDGIETDVRLARDGGLVLFHDRLLPDGRPLAALTLAEIERALAPKRCARVEEALAAFPGLLWNLEIKAPAALPPLLALLRSHPSRSRVVLTSFDHAALLEHAVGAGLRLGALVAHRPAPPSEAGAGAVAGIPRAFDLVVWAYETLDGRQVARLREHGTASWVYGPETLAEHVGLAGLGLEAVITDHPEHARGLRGAGSHRD